MAIKFDKNTQEGNTFINQLAENLGHPEEKCRTGILLKAVLHAWRHQITISESLHLLSLMPSFLKAVNT